MEGKTAQKRDRVLLAYPDGETRRTIKCALEQAGFNDILVFDDGESAVNALRALQMGEGLKSVRGLPLSEIGLVISHFSDLKCVPGISLSRLVKHDFSMNAEIVLISRPHPHVTVEVNKGFANKAKKAESLVLDLLGVTSTTVFGSDHSINNPVLDIVVDSVNLRDTGCTVFVQSPFLPSRVAELLYDRCLTN